MIIEAEDKRQLAIQLAALQAKGIKVEPPYQVHVPDYTEKVPEKAFAHCEVGQIALPNSATEIVHEAFAHCEALTEVVLPKGLASLPSSTFAYSGLVSLHLPQRVSILTSDVSLAAGH